MGQTRIVISDLTVRYRLSYDKNYTVKDWLIEATRRLTGKWHPEYHTALHDINVDINDGDVVGVVGPNGSGKSTLLRAISGVIAADTGTIQKNGRISSLLSLGTGFNNQLSGLDNIRFQGLLIGMSPKEIDASIEVIADFADIGKFIDVPMKYYSSGMISRLSFAIILAIKPDILLIDEIFSVGDLAFQRKSEKAMQRLLEQASCQMIVTHNLSFVRESCNRALYINEGRLIGDGAPDAIIDQYIADVENSPPPTEG